ncbi:MAG: hypothetical protein PVF69_01535 [Gemmatimonadota bacterium]|jgi:hypothetical protein
MPRPRQRSPLLLAVASCVPALAIGAPQLHAQLAERDSIELLEEMHDMQREFEEFRVSRIPVEERSVDGFCDVLIGRICINYRGEDAESFPAEFREVGQARVELIRSLTDAFEQIHDRWILGQLVHYLVERVEVGEAERFALECGIVDDWWCAALRGYVLHVRTEYVEAEEAFREALELMPDSVRFEWTTPRYVFTPDAVEDFNAAPAEERERRFELLWRLSDPLFLFEGNDRLTDHFARLVEVEFRKDAANPLGLEWGDDLAETLVRYGRNTGYSRTFNPRGVRFGLQDTRRVVGHHAPKSRGFLFPEQFLESPAEIPPESWITAPREARTWYSPPYAPDVRGLETQVGRFRRDERMLVVGAYRPTLPADSLSSRVVNAWGPDGSIQGTPYAALFLVPEDGSAPELVQGRDPEGVLTIETQPGRYVSSLEVVDLEGRQAWRARQGVVQRPLTPGLISVSDLMILKPDAPLPESLDDALPDLRPGIRVHAEERFPVIWEVYGLGVEEQVRVTIGFSRGRPGFLERVGEFLGVVEPEGDVDITFDETGPSTVETVFRSVEISLPDLEPGEYTLHLRLDLAGRTPVVTSRPIIVEE